MRFSKLGFAIIFAVGCAAEPVAAEEFLLSYTFSFGQVLEIELTGEVQDDGDTVVVSAIDSARLDGEAGPPLVFVTSLADLVEGTKLHKPVVTLSGQNNDISICSDTTCATDFISFDGVKQFFGTPGIFTSVPYGSTYSGGTNAGEPYDPKNYSLTPK